MTDVIIVGSKGSVKQVNKWKTSDCIVLALAEVWKAIKNWDVVIHPGSFINLPKKGKTVNGQAVINACVANGLNRQAMKKCLIFSAAYWALVTLKPSRIGFIGCDIAEDDNLPYADKLAEWFMQLEIDAGIPLVSYSRKKRTLLPFKQVSFTRRDNI